MCYTAHKTLENSKETAIKKKDVFHFLPNLCDGFEESPLQVFYFFFFFNQSSFCL